MNDVLSTRSLSSGTRAHRGVQAGFVLLGMAVCGIAAAQDWKVHPALQDRWTFQLGAYAPSVDTKASLNGSGGRVGTSVSFEDDLNLADRKTTPTLLGSVRLGEKWRVEAEYFSLSRSGTSTISKTINWGDNTYPIGASVSSEFNSDVFRLSAGYSFVKNNQEELGVVLGLHTTDFSTALGTPTLGTKKGDTLAPLPTIGVYGAYAFTPRWLLSGRLDYFSLGISDYDGKLLNFSAGVDYRFSRNFGAGLAYRYIDYDITVTKSSYNGGINYRFSGPMIYGVVSF